MISPDSIRQAKAEGFSDPEIIDFLSQTNPSVGSRISKARELGFEPNEIVDTFLQDPLVIPSIQDEGPAELETPIEGSVPISDREMALIQAEEAGIIPLQRERPGRPEGLQQEVGFGEALTGLGRIGVETALLPLDIAEGVQTAGQRLIGDLIPQLQTPREIDSPITGRRVAEDLFGPATESEQQAVEIIKNSIFGGLAGGPLGILVGSASTPVFQAVSEAIEESDQPETFKAAEEFLLQSVPFVGNARGRAQRVATPADRINSLKSEINPLRERGLPLNSERVSAEISPIETIADIAEVPRPIEIEEVPGTGRTFPVPDIPPFDFIREGQLDTVTENHTSRGQIADMLREVNAENETTARRTTSQLYEISKSIAQDINFDGVPFIREAFSFLRDRDQIRASEFPTVRRGFAQTIQELGYDPEVVQNVRKVNAIDNFLGDHITESELPSELRNIVEDSERGVSGLIEERNRIDNILRDQLDAGATAISLDKAINAVQNLNNIIDFTPRDLRRDAAPSRKLNRIRISLNNTIESVGAVSDPSFTEAYNLARDSHRMNVETYGTDFNQKLKTRESATGVIGTDLSNKDAPTNIRNQLNILNQSVEGQSIIPEFERTVLAEMFSQDGISPDRLRIWEDTRRELSTPAREAGDFLVEASRRTPIEQSTDIGRFNEPIMKQMENPRGLQNARRQIVEAADRMGTPELQNLYEQEFTARQLQKTFDPETLLINREKLGQLERNSNLRRSLDIINGEGFSENYIETQRNILDINETMTEALNNERIARERMTKQFSDSQKELVNVYRQIQQNQNMTKPQKIEAFKEAFTEVMRQPLTVGSLFFKMLPVVGRFVYPSTKGFGIIKSYSSKIAGNPMVNRLRGQTKLLVDSRKKISAENAGAAARTLDAGVRNIDTEDEELLEKATDDMVGEIFD